MSLPGIYLARIVATVSCNVNNEISPGAHGKTRWSEVPLGSEDAESLNSPYENVSDVTEQKLTSREKAGSGEHQPESPKNSLQGVAVDSLPVVAIGSRKVSPGLQSAEFSSP
jgi:hypothetical protein